MRRFVVLLVIALLPLAAEAQKKYRIAVIEREQPLLVDPNIQSLLQGFRTLGYRDHKDFSLVYESADGRDERYPALCAEVVKMNVDLIVTRGTAATAACQRATRSIPIIFLGVEDAVGNGLVASRATPGGNATGFSTATDLLYAKRFDVLRKLMPNIMYVGALLNLGNPAIVSQKAQLEYAAELLGIHVETFDVRNAGDLRTAMVRAERLRIQALYVPVEPFTEANRRLIADLARKFKLPTFNAETVFVEAGGLISYGSDNQAQYLRVAKIADKLWRGAKPGDIPVEQPARFSIAINMKTAIALRIPVSRELLLEADRVIE